MWSVTINNLLAYEAFPDRLVEDMRAIHPKYPADMNRALEHAKRMGLASAVLAGGRVPNPYGNGESVNLSIAGHTHESELSHLISEEVHKTAEPGTVMYEHRAAVKALREFESEHGKHQHEFKPFADHVACGICSVHLQQGFLHLQEECGAEAFA